MSDFVFPSDQDRAESPELDRVCRELESRMGSQSDDKGTTDAAVAAIDFALQPDSDGVEFLRVWFHGDFDAIRKEWPDAPESVFVGANPLHPATLAVMETATQKQSSVIADAIREAIFMTRSTFSKKNEGWLCRAVDLELYARRLEKGDL
jgi:hypothetical protein